MSEEIDKLAGATSLKISEMTLESDLMGAEKFPFVKEGVKTNFITTLNRIKEYTQKDVCQYIRDLRETDLNSFKGDNEADICVIGVQRNNKFATPENHYPREEAGILIVVGTITDKTNQIYQTYDSNRLFIRCATSSGVDGEFSEWQEIAKISDVLTKNNTTPFSPTNDYNPATKKYVDSYHYGKSLKIPNVETVLHPTSLQGQDAQSKIDELFGGAESFKAIVEDILTKHTRYYFHFDNNFTNCIELGCVNAWRNNERTSYELHFIVVYNTNNIYYTSRIGVVYNVDVNATKYYVAHLVQSDNLTTLTKKTAAEYKAISSKDGGTMYAITDA